MKNNFSFGCVLGLILVVAFPVFFTISSTNGDDSWLTLIKRLFGISIGDVPSYAEQSIPTGRWFALGFIIAIGLLWTFLIWLYSKTKSGSKATGIN